MKQLLETAMRRLLDDEPLDAFCDWFGPAMARAMINAEPQTPVSPAEAQRHQRHMARQLWGQMPVPSNRWRARGLPRLERNAPCHCGSGLKYKQCCAEFEHLPLPVDPEALLVTALELADSRWLTPQSLRLVPPQALGNVAHNWNEAGQPGKTVSALQPLFADTVACQRLDARYEMALDALVEAQLDLGQESQRRVLLERMARHPDKVLATTARCRLVSILADQGEPEQAWKLLRETMRLSPDDPQLWPLELTLLLSQGRDEEARLRAPLLAARARQRGMDDLADVLLRLGQEGLDAIPAGPDSPWNDPLPRALQALAETTPAEVDRTTLAALYRIERLPAESDSHRTQSGGEEAFAVSVWPQRKLTQLNQRWRRRFLVGKPDLTSLDGDVELLLDQLPEALAFLQAHPAAWLSDEVLDDLLMAACAVCVPGAPRPLQQAVQRLADHALAVLRALAGGAQMHWIEHNNRPLLRCLAVAVVLAQMRRDDTRAAELMAWSLALNPHDNHGWRGALAPLWIAQGRAPDALRLLEQYPGDWPPAEHLRALSLFVLNRREEAEAALRRAHASHPMFLNSLLPTHLDAPPDDPGPGLRVGGAMAAWQHRQEWRPLWVRTGALAWAQALQLPDPPPPRPVRPRKKAELPARAASVAPAAKPAASRRPRAIGATFGTREVRQLQKTCSSVPRLYGLLQAVAWSPRMLMPNSWLSPAIALHDRLPASRSQAAADKALASAVNATMALYNHLNAEVLSELALAQPGLTALDAVVGQDDEAACAWAAGFVQGCELSAAAWAHAGHKIGGSTGPFARLRALAARARVQDEEGRVLQDDGRAVLQGLQPDAPDPAPAALALALLPLWPVVVASRGAGPG